MNSFYETATRLLERGYSIIPIIPGEKRPGEWDGKQWHGMNKWQRYCSERVKPYELDMWAAWPNPGICVALGLASNLIAIDYDYGSEALRAELLALLPASPIQKTGAKGFTAFYRGFAHVPKKFTCDQVSVVELLGSGRQTVLPPSVHPEGMAYRWLTEKTLENTSVDELPRIHLDYYDEVAAVIKKYQVVPDKIISTRQLSSTGQPTGNGDPYWREINDKALLNLSKWVPILFKDYITGAGGGYRVDPIWRKVTKLTKKVSINPKGIVDFGTGQNMTAIDLVMAAAGCDHNTAITWIDNAINPQEAFVMPKSSHKKVVAPPPVALTEKIKSPTYIPQAFPTAKGAVGKLVNYITETAIRPQPILAMAAALCAIGALAGRKYMLAGSKTRTNIYIVSLADSGAGKNHSRSVIDQLFTENVECEQYLGGSKIASGTGLLSALERHPVMLFQQDEFGGFLMAATNKERSPRYLTEIVDHVTELFTASHTIYRGIEFADQQTRQRKELNQPCLCIHGTTVPGHFWKALQSSNSTDGSLARFLIFETEESYPYSQYNQQKDPPPDLINLLRRVAEPLGDGNMSGIMCAELKPQKMCEISCTEEASKFIQALDRENIEYLRKITGTPTTSFWARRVELMNKVAMIHAIGIDPEGPIITLEDFLFAQNIVDRSINKMVDGVERFVSDNQAESQTKKVIEIFRKEGGTMSRSDLYRKTHFLGRDRETVIKSLIEAGTIEAEVIPTGTKPKTIYTMVR